MAQYNFDEGGSMAAYFALSLLVLVLIPTTFSALPSRSALRKKVIVCECPECVRQRQSQKKSVAASILKPKISLKLLFIAVGWVAVAGLVYIVSTTTVDNKIYDPFEILGIRKGIPEKEIKRHWRKLSLKFHPDKVKLAINETMEEVASKYVEFTKAYKSLTDENIRRNLEQFGHPDGRQEMSMGIAIPKSWTEGATGMYFLLGYSLLLGGSLPFIVGRWWFRSRAYTKDGVHAKSAETFFKRVREDSSMEDIIKALAAAWQHEKFSSKKIIGESELKKLEEQIKPQVEEGALTTEDGPLVKRALILIYAHLVRIPIYDAKLKKELKELLTHSPVLLTSLLNITLSRNWLGISLGVMHLNANLAQAVKHSKVPSTRLLQLPGLKTDEVQSLAADALKYNAGPEISEIESVVKQLKAQGDARAADIEKAGERWGTLEVVDAYFKVIGEKIITPGAFVNLVMKLRVAPPLAKPTSEKKKSDFSPKNEKKDDEFLLGRTEAESIAPTTASALAHAPHWPLPRRPQWWVVVGDDKSGRVIVPPIKISEVPYSDETKDRNYRSWKITFQAPNQVGVFSWRVRFVSDTFVVGEDVARDLTLKLDDPSLLETADLEEDEISDPEEDTLAGQMAAMRGQKVKKIPEGEEDEEDESGTEEEESDSSSSSDSD